MSEFGKSFDRAQADYDAQELPPEWNCDREGHQWHRHRSAEIQGESVVEYKCRVCGKLDVI